MSDVTQPDPAEWAFDPEHVWRAHTTEELFGGAATWTGEESFEIGDLTSEESAAFWAAVRE